MKAYYFGTCVIDACFPQAGLAGIELLQPGMSRSFFLKSSRVVASRPITPAFPTKPARSLAIRLRRSPRIIPSSCRPGPAPGC